MMKSNKAKFNKLKITQEQKDNWKALSMIILFSVASILFANCLFKIVSEIDFLALFIIGFIIFWIFNYCLMVIRAILG